MGGIIVDCRQEGSIRCVDARISVLATLIAAVGERGIEGVVQSSDHAQRGLSSYFRGQGLDFGDKAGMSGQERG